MNKGVGMNKRGELTPLLKNFLFIAGIFVAIFLIVIIGYNISQIQPKVISKIGLTIDIQKERFTGNHKNILNYVIGIFDLFLLSVEDDFRDDVTFDERDIKINDKSVNVLDCLYNSEKEIVVDGRWLESIVAKSTIK